MEDKEIVVGWTTKRGQLADLITVWMHESSGPCISIRRFPEQYGKEISNTQIAKNTCQVDLAKEGVELGMLTEEEVPRYEFPEPATATLEQLEWVRQIVADEFRRAMKQPPAASPVPLSKERVEARLKREGIPYAWQLWGQGSKMATRALAVAVQKGQETREVHTFFMEVHQTSSTPRWDRDSMESRVRWNHGWSAEVLDLIQQANSLLRKTDSRRREKKAKRDHRKRVLAYVAKLREKEVKE